MATIDTSQFPSANLRFQMAEAPTGIDFAALQQQKLANATAAQNLETSKYNAQRQKLSDAMSDVILHETPSDTLAAIDRHVADGTLTAAQAAEARKSVPTIDENGNFDKDAFNSYKLRELQHYSSGIEGIIKGLQTEQQQQRIKNILKQPEDTVAVDQEQALFNQLNPSQQPAGTNALAPTAAPAPSVNMLDPVATRRQITALRLENDPAATAIANDLAAQLKAQTEAKQFQPTATEIAYQLYKNDREGFAAAMRALKGETGTGVGAGATAGGAPKLKQGERWNPTDERVEQVPGSAEYIKQSKLHGTDYGALQSVNSKTELADKQVDRLLSPENEDAFNNLFGGYSAYVTQQFSGKTAGLKSDLDSLKQNLKSAGLELMKSGGGGAIGTITEREWPILEGMIESLSPKMSESDARNKLKAIKAKMANIRSMAADKYDTTWGETQYYKDGAAQTPPAATSISVTLPNGKVVTFPNQKAADEFKKEAGIK